MLLIATRRDVKSTYLACRRHATPLVEVRVPATDVHLAAAAAAAAAVEEEEALLYWGCWWADLFAAISGRSLYEEHQPTTTKMLTKDWELVPTQPTSLFARISVALQMITLSITWRHPHTQVPVWFPLPQL
jgi:hypothetical protein